MGNSKINKKVKKIIFSSYDSINNPYFGGGGALSIHKVAQKLTDKYDIVVITSKFKNSKDQIIDGVKYERIGIGFAGSKINQLVYSLLLPYYALRKSYDVWIESFTPPISTGFIQIFTKKPVIGLVHMLAGKDMKRKYKIPFDKIEQFGLKTYKHFIVNSNTFLKKIKSVNRKAFFYIVGNGIDKVFTDHKKGRHILYIGRIEINQKGIDLLLLSYKLLTSKMANCPKLIIAGGGSPNEIRKTKAMIHDYSLSTKVKMIGKVSGKVKQNLMKQSILIAIPSRFETFSIVALEAFSYGLPIVSFKIDGLSWTPKYCSFKAKKFNVNDFSILMENLIRKPPSKKECVKSINFAKKSTWDKIAQKYIHVIEGVLLNEKN